jgi:hypothetical protein
MIYFLLLTLFSVSSTFSQGSKGIRFETYVTAHQVDSLLSTLKDREKALQAFQEIGISKVYLETVRQGYIPQEEILHEAIRFFQQNGVEVIAGVATLAGPEFGVKSNDSTLWLNYQAEKTQTDLADHFRHIAKFFDEIMIDDFFATNDTTELSQAARGGRSWSEYRLDLMMDFAERFILQPAREANPDIRFILKYPQWYDRFHKFGYDVVRGPSLFERIWVGTETRNPETVRFGFVMPTQGYINFSWLRSMAGKQTGGGWFDFGDCTPQSYLMQAYQTVLAGAKEIVLFEAGGVIQKNPCIEPLLQRKEAVLALGELIEDRKALGMAAYKPPHSDGSDVHGAANLYLFDYLAAMGLSPLPVAAVPDNLDCVFLPRQAVADSDIAQKIANWLEQGATVIVTPDFLAALDDRKTVEAAGYEYPLALTFSEKTVADYRVDEKEFRLSAASQLRPIPLPPNAKVICAGIAEGNEIPILTESKAEKGSRILVLNLCTFTHEEFGPGKEEFLPPRNLTIKNISDVVVNRIRREIPPPYPIEIHAPNEVGIYFYEGNLLVLANFKAIPAVFQLQSKKNQPMEFAFHENFPHAPETRMEMKGDRIDVVVPAWELAVVKWE